MHEPPSDFGRFKMLGTLEDIGYVIRSWHVDEVIIALPSHMHQYAIKTVKTCERLGASFKLIPDLYELNLSRIDMEAIEGIPLLRAPTEGQGIVADYRSVGLTLGRHPLALLRTRLARDGILTAAGLWQLEDGARVRTAGLVITRQRPMTASGVTFMTLEDETGHINLVVWLQVAERQRRVFLESRLLEVSGKLQRQDNVLHVIVTDMRDRSRLLGDLNARSRDFH